MPNLFDEGYSKGDPYGTAVSKTLLPYLENHRDDLVVLGAGYPKAMERMLSANQGLRRRFSPTIVFSSYTPDELWQLTRLIAGQDDDIVAPQTEEVLRPVLRQPATPPQILPMSPELSPKQRSSGPLTRVHAATRQPTITFEPSATPDKP